MNKLYFIFILTLLLFPIFSLAQTTTTSNLCGNGYCDFYETKENCASDCTHAGASCSQGAIPAAGCTCNRASGGNYLTETSGYCCWNSYSATACATILQACSDSDNGNNIYVKGTGSGNYRGATIRSYQTIIDLCVTSAQLNEAYCESSGMLSVAGINCGTAGCSNGVCLQATTTTTAPTTTTTGATTTTAATTTTIIAKQLTADLTGVKAKTFPQESMELKLTVKDETGKLVTDASVSGSIKQAGVVKNNLYFSYSYLCDCYKTTAWLSENYLGDYTIEAKASKTNYPSLTLTQQFAVEKPVLKISVKTDKDSYFANDKIIFTITATDQNGNPVKPFWEGDIRDETGALVQLAYPYTSGDIYKYDYYSKSDDVGKTYTFNAKAKWKEQTVTASTSISIQKRAISADVVLEKTELKTGDYIRGKIKVIDQTGQEIKDAFIDAQLVNEDGQQVQFITTTYSQGYYELDARKIDEWQKAGEYKLKIKIEKYPEKITIEKPLKIIRDKLQVTTEFDSASYKPGDRVFLKMLLTSPTGEVLQDAYINGEIFPLSQEPRKIPGEPYPPYIKSIEACRIYLSPQGPIFYQGKFIQKYFIDEIWLPESCPTGTYVLKIKAGRAGYDDVEDLKEFQVVLRSIVIESGARVKSVGNGADINFYTELKSESGEIVTNARVFALLHPLEDKSCLKKIDYYWDHFSKRYSANQFISSPECPDGKYVLELTAEQQQYATSNSTQVLDVKYEKGYEYREFRPRQVEDEFCQTISCGPGCFQRTCSTPTCTNIFDEGCISKCKTIPSGAGIDVVESCLKTCEKEQCGPQQSSQDEMLRKLEEIRKEISETKEISRETGQQVSTVENLLRAIINFISRLFGISPTQVQESKPPEKVSAPVEAPPSEEVPFVGGGFVAG